MIITSVWLAEEEGWMDGFAGEDGGRGWMDWISGGGGASGGGDWIGFCLLLVLAGGVWANWELGLPLLAFFFLLFPETFGAEVDGWMLLARGGEDYCIRLRPRTFLARNCPEHGLIRPD